MTTYDTVIVGAGLSGLRTARLLAEEGLSVLLVDRSPDVSRTVRTTGIFVRRTLESFPLPAAYLGPPIRRVTLVSPVGRRQTLESAQEEFRVGRMGDLYAHELSQALRAGAEWLPGHEFEGIEPLHRDTMILLRDGDTVRVVRARFLVGADGTHSSVAAALHLDRNTRWLTAAEDVFVAGREGSTLALEGTPQLMCFLDPEFAPGYIGWAAWDGEALHLGAGGRPDDFQPGLALQAVRRRAAATLADAGLLVDPDALPTATPDERRAGTIPVGGILERIGCIRGLLVGDASGAPSPLTAGGLDPCLRLSVVAAKAISAHILRDDQSALQEYQGSRFRPRFASRLFARRVFEGLDDRRLLEGTCLLLRLPLVHMVARQVFFGANSFPDDRSVRVGLPARSRGTDALHSEGR